MTFIPTHAQQLVIIQWMDSCIPKEEDHKISILVTAQESYSVSLGPCWLSSYFRIFYGRWSLNHYVHIFFINI